MRQGRLAFSNTSFGCSSSDEFRECEWFFFNEPSSVLLVPVVGGMNKRSKVSAFLLTR